MQKDNLLIFILGMILMSSCMKTIRIHDLNNRVRKLENAAHEKDTITPSPTKSDVVA